MNSKYKCRVESFDPYVISSEFKLEGQEKSTTVKVNDKWRFHKIGLSGNKDSTKEKGTIGWITTLDEILEYTHLTNKVIDIFKLDIETNEWNFLVNFDVNYACKYIKQIMLETHTKPDGKRDKTFNQLKELRKLEKCYSLFHRDTRFFQHSNWGQYGFTESEFQLHKAYKLDLSDFENDLELVYFTLTFGELYFVNENFLNN